MAASRAESLWDSDRQIAKLFEQAKEDFEHETNKKLSVLRRFDTVDDFIEQIRKEKAAFGSFREHEHPNLFRHVRNALKPIQILAKLFSGPSGNAAFASGVVLNAVSFLIDTADDVSFSYDTLELLFEKIEDVSVELDILSRHALPSELGEKVVALFIAVIKICSLSRKLAKQGRFLEYAKGLRGKDPAVSEQLAAFDRLRASLSSRVQSLAYDTALSTRQEAAGIKATLQQQSEKEEDFREELRAKIDADKAMRIEDIKEQQAAKIRETLQPTVRNRVIHNSFKSTRAKHSGSWIFGNGQFQSWAQRSFPVLWLCGGPGIGKSSLTSHIIEFLRQQLVDPVNGSPRDSIAYFYFKEADRELRSFGNALRTMASDIADGDPLFFRHVYKACTDSPSAMHSISLCWEDVFQSYFNERSCQSAVYLIFDGLDEALDTEVEEFLPMLQREATGRIYILLVGRPEMALQLTQTLGKIPPEVRVSATTNNSDISLFVDESLPKLPHYKQISQALRNDIRQTLISKAGGMFLWVQLILKELQPYYKSKNIRPILTHAPASISDMIHSILTRLDRTLKGDDLFDFNELLVWATWAKRPMSIGELQILVKLSSEENEDIYLEEPLREQFSSFFELSSLANGEETGGQSSSKTDPASSKKAKLSLRAESDSDDDSGSSSEVDDSSEDEESAEASTAKVNFNHTSIRQYFQAGINTKVGAAGIETLESKVHVVLVLLKSIVQWRQWSGFDAESESSVSSISGQGPDGQDEDWESVKGSSGSDSSDDDDDDDPNANALISYAANNWHLHLATLDPASLRSEDQSAIASLLIRMFRDRDIVWIWVEDVEDFSSKWLETTENAQLVSRWLLHFLTVGLLSEEDANWVRSLESGPSEGLLSTIMDDFAKTWLENENSTWSWSTVFQWLTKYTEAIETPNANDSTEGATTTPKETPADAVRRIARRYSPNETSLWHAHVAMVMRKLQQPKEAMKEIELAIEMNTAGWHPLMIKAKILASQEKWREAIDTMNLSNQILEGDPARMEKHIRDYWENRLFVAEWYHDLGQHDQALESYRSCLEHDPDDYDFLLPMLEIWFEKDDSSGAMRFIRELNEAKVAKSGHPRLVHAIIALRDKESFHFDIFETARRNQELELVRATYNQALSIAVSKNRQGQVAWMQYFLGILFERYLSQRDDAMDIWERTIRDSAKAVKGTSLFKARNAVVRDLCNLYIDKVSQLGKDSPVAAKYFEKVKDIGAPDTFILWQYDTASALGVLHRLLGEDEQARKCFRSRVKAGFDLLIDKDPTEAAETEPETSELRIWNDYAAYYEIAHSALALAGNEHRKDCLAAFSLLGIHEKTRPAEIEPQRAEAGAGQTNPEPKEIGVKTGPPQPLRRPTLPTFLPSQTNEFATAATITDWVFASCDGCDKDLNIPDDSYVCTMCIDMNFCSDCQPKLKNNTLGFRICSPNHELLYIPKAPGPLPKDMVRYDDEYVPILEWLSKLKKIWGV